MLEILLAADRALVAEESRFARRLPFCILVRTSAKNLVALGFRVIEPPLRFLHPDLEPTYVRVDFLELRDTYGLLHEETYACIPEIYLCALATSFGFFAMGLVLSSDPTNSQESAGHTFSIGGAPQHT
jgi:hypothetical protein